MDKILLIIFTLFLSLSSTLQLFLVKEGIEETDIITNVIYFTIAVLIGLFIYIPFIYYPNILSDLIVTKKTLFYLVGEAYFLVLVYFVILSIDKENVSCCFDGKSIYNCYNIFMVYTSEVMYLLLTEKLE